MDLFVLYYIIDYVVTFKQKLVGAKLKEQDI